MKKTDNQPTPPQALGRLQRFLRFQAELWPFCWRRLQEHGSMTLSSALTFRSIFAMIPVLVLIILILKGMGVIDDSKARLAAIFDELGISSIQIVQEHDAPAPPPAPSTNAINQKPEESAIQNPQSETKKVVTYSAAEQILDLVDKLQNRLTIGTLGPLGVALLIWTAITLLITMEGALNKIYEAPQGRSLGRRIMMYWFLLTLGPLLILVAIFIVHKVQGVFAQIPILSYLLLILGWTSSLIMGVAVVVIIYKFMPNTNVRFRSALLGAVVAVIVWNIGRWGFNLYVRKVVLAGGGSSFYGAIGLLPLFLMYVNLSWNIFLFGAELSHTATNLRKFKRAEQARKLTLGPNDMLAVTVAVAEPFLEGRGSAGFERLTRKINLPEESICKLLDRLEEKKILISVGPEERMAYMLARPAEKIPLLEILDIEDPQKAAADNIYENGINAKITRVKGNARENLGNLTLADIMK